MAPRGGSSVSPGELPGRRCRCGHLPNAHLKVAPVGSASGSYRLLLEGPCEICGAAACGRFDPSV